jgi:hypothetical protein
MSFTLDSYRDQRDKFLSQIVQTLSKEDRFVAGWLTGSLSKNGGDSVSDIDLSLVVSEEYTSNLCSRFAAVSSQTSP